MDMAQPQGQPEAACALPANAPPFGESGPAAAWTAELCEQLRGLAAGYLARERADHTLLPTALVNEAYIKLARAAGGPWRDANHFRAVAAAAMRQILVDHARRRAANKRGGDRLRTTLDDDALSTTAASADVLDLHEALDELAQLDQRKARVVELRFFGGMTCEEAAATLSVSPKTAEADWYMARAWMRLRIRPG
jgi:RNA polymerase sigma factor (TIGR02999 family)